MSVLPLITDAEATEAQAEALKLAEKTFGAIPNLARVMVHSPALLKGYVGLASALDTGVLPRATRERLAITIAQSNGCGYCLSAHTYLGEKGAGLSADQLAAARKAEADDPRTAALLVLARAANEKRGMVDAEEIAAARAAGASDAELAEVLGHVGLNLLTNIVNNTLGTEIDFPVVEP